MLVAVGCDADRYEEGEGADVCMLFWYWWYCVCSLITLRWFVATGTKGKKRSVVRLWCVSQSGRLAACAACLGKSERECNVIAVSTNGGIDI